MLARAAGRKLRRDAFRTPTTLSDQLTLPWLCPALLRSSSSTPDSPTTWTRRRRQRRPSHSHANSPSPSPSPSFRHDSRSLATSAELQPPAPSTSFNPFAESAWARHIQSPGLSRLSSWDPANPLVVHDAVAASPSIRGLTSRSMDAIELHQNIYACLRVGRLDRAAAIIERLAPFYKPDAPEVVDAHNAYLQTLLELNQPDPSREAMASIKAWYRQQMVSKHIQPNAQTFVTLIRAAMSFLADGAKEDAVRKHIAAAHQQGQFVVDEINASPEFSDEEWDLLIRLQPETFNEPPPVEHMQHLHLNSPSGRRDLIDLGLAANHVEPIKPVFQKGLGLDSLKEALTVFSEDTVPYPHDMEGTQAEKDRAYAYARQVQMEQDGLAAAVKRWKQESEKMQEIGIHGVLQSKPIQAIMYSWYVALVPLFKKRLAHVARVLSAGSDENRRDDALEYGPWLEKCKPESLAAMTVARAITSSVKDRAGGHALKVSALSISLGSDISDHIESEAEARRDAFLKKQRKQTRAQLSKQLSRTAQETSSKSATSNPFSYEKSQLPVTVRAKLGAICIELLLEAATLTVTADDPRTGNKVSRNIAAFHHQIGFFQGKNIGVIVPHHDLIAKLQTDSVHSIHSVRLPMVVEPRPWSGFQNGGYYTIPQSVVRQKGGDRSQRAYAQSAIDNGDMDQVMAGLDVLGRVPWQINAPVLQVMAQVWNNGESIGGLIGDSSIASVERPQEPPADATYQERAKWGQALKEYENYVGGLHSQRCFQNFQLETARAFVNEKSIFFPHNVDFRGRAYPVPPILNHIGADLARGLLKFGRGKELGTVGLQWLKIHLANLYGFDKASLREREQFAMDNINEIYDSATSPLDGRRWWAKAEDPWQCLACCMELKNALDSPDPTRYLSQLPVHQDGTCNGLQHYAALGGDHAGARQVNLEPSDRPQDIYTGVAELVKEMVAKEAAQGMPVATFINGYITRKVVKRTVMTNVYGVTFMGAKAQVQDELKSTFPNFRPTDKIRSLGSVALYVALKIFEALGKIFNGAQEIQYWLGECGERITTSITAEQIKRIQNRFEGLDPSLLVYESQFAAPKKITASQLNKLNKSMENFKTSIIWTTPLKMPIVQPYRKDMTKVIKTKVQNITVTKKSASDEVDKRKQLQAFPPNFIHSLDASHMTLSALKANEMGLDFAAVHDSFWTHACDIPNLNVILRDAFVRMHSEDIINRLAAEFEARYAGALYRASLLSSSEVARTIIQWRLERRTGMKTPFALKRTDATFEEVALEAKRRELLKSEDVKERQKGEKMVTPTSIWLANQDPKALHSFRLSLLGETQDKGSAHRQTEVRDKLLGAEADALTSDAADDVTDTVTDAVTTTEATLDIVEEDVEDLGKDPQSAGVTAKRKAPSRIAADKATIQVWIPLTFPPVPQKGSWDVSRLRESKYFFS
ncbi:DNA/RNA polymerase [Decorospora gaudefroyi]|uniref:DNA-directed RNA polymerase n=1 Tax=Decorospora gaudefroyi TaxID=184978 RepID=A0A6A5KVM1_9PLEO|nr:DNA/RNA polymerase [Decorospora gaudefroyi]